jgi:hypothetical protein
MAETLETKSENLTDTEKVRQRIVAQEEKIAEHLGEVSEKIKDTLDWRQYAGQYPFITLGVAAGLGLLASRMIVPEPPTTMEKVSDIIQEAAGNRVGNYLSSKKQRTILSSLSGLALAAIIALAASCTRIARITGVTRVAIRTLVAGGSLWASGTRHSNWRSRHDDGRSVASG